MDNPRETIVSSFFYYMWNGWSRKECEAVFGQLSEHLWNKWCFLSDGSAHGAAEKFYCELSTDNRALLVERACSLYNGNELREPRAKSVIWVCADCGSRDTDVLAWCRINEGYKLVEVSEESSEGYYCNNCLSHPRMCTLEEYLEKMNAWWARTDFRGLERITGFRQSDFDPAEGYADFVAACNEYWNTLSYDDKRRLYAKFEPYV